MTSNQAEKHVCDYLQTCLLSLDVLLECQIRNVFITIERG